MQTPSCPEVNNMPKPATEITIQANMHFIPPGNLREAPDFKASRRGLIEEVRDLQITNDAGKIIWNMKA